MLHCDDVWRFATQALFAGMAIAYQGLCCAMLA
jgi:hypothetical protein